MNATEEFLAHYFNPDGSLKPTLGNREPDLDRFQAMSDLMWEMERDEEKERQHTAHLRFVG
ncbi:MAG: hypothetical protein Q7T49_02675 [bacterium]|nr:hypothetical protein [bacterium]